MGEKTMLKQPRQEDIVVGLSLLVALLVLLTASRMPIWGDAEPCWYACSALVRGDTPNVGDFQRGDIFSGPDGKRYCKYPALQTFHGLPHVIGVSLTRSSDAESAWFLLMAAMAPALEGGLLVSGMMLLTQQLGVPPRRAIWMSMLVFFGSPLWVYSRYLYGEIQQATLIIWIIYTWVRWRGQETPLSLVGHGVLLGLALNAKSTLFLFTPLLLADIAVRKRSVIEIIRGAAFLAVGAAPGLLLFLWYNHVRFGSLFTLGYSDEPFSTPFLKGAYGLLFSSGKSVFLYFPLALLGVLGGRSFASRQKALTLGMLVPGTAYFGLIACWWVWAGDWGWGPRLLVPLAPLVGVVAVSEFHCQRRLRLVFLGLALLGMAVNSLGVGIHARTVIAHSYRSLERLEATHFIPKHSPVVTHWRWAEQAMAGADSRPAFDVWWIPWRQSYAITLLTMSLVIVGLSIWLWQTSVYAAEARNHE